MANIPSKERLLIKKFLPKNLVSFFRKLIYPEKIYIIEDNLKCLFQTHYQKLAALDLDQKTALRNAEFKVYSKHGGDGLLLYIFSKVGVTNRTFVEIGTEDGKECNTANLSLNLGWQGILIDANKDWIASAQRFYQEKLGEGANRVKAVTCFITAENINQLLSENGFQGEIDLLSIDIDGNDYWVWKAIAAVNPRVVVAEYNASFGLRSITIKYNPTFHLQGDLYFGASLPALAKLAKEKGYILVGCDSYGHDAFFIRQDVAEGKLNELSADKAFYPQPYLLKTIGSTEKQFEQVKNLDFEYI